MVSALSVLALGEVLHQLHVLLDVAFEIHRDEGGQLHEARIDLAERAARTAPARS